MGILRGVVSFVDNLNEKVGLGIAWLTTLLVLVVCYDVFTRYLLKNSSVAVQELEWHLFAMIFLIGAAYSFKHNKHVRVDVLYTNFTPKTQALVNFIGSLLFLVPFALVVIWSSRNFVINSFNMGEISPDPGGLPARYILKSMIPLGFFLLLLQGLSLSCQSLLTLLGEGEDNV